MTNFQNNQCAIINIYLNLSVNLEDLALIVSKIQKVIQT